MPFKIIQTLEKGLPRLSIVPSVWEDGGKLFWPPEKVKNRARLVRDENSFPSPKWDILQCVVKRNNIPTFKEAEDEICLMENCTDTDSEMTARRAGTGPATTAVMEPPLAATLLENHFEDMMQNLTQSANNNEEIYMEPSSATSNQIVTNEMTCVSVLDGDQIIANQNILIEKMNNQDLILQNLVETVQKVTQKVAELSVQLDECLFKFLDKIEQPVSVTLLKDANPGNNESFCFKQIMDKQQLDSLEKKLMDKAERSKLHNLFSFLFQPCEGQGLTFAYKLIDSMISREFLCECSWSGGSRGILSKIAIKDYKNFIKFFFDMVRSWDPKFTMGQTENFFKVILKNAVKRKSMKNLRSSSKRIRKSKPKDQASTSAGVSAYKTIQQNKTSDMEVAEVKERRKDNEEEMEEGEEAA